MPSIVDIPAHLLPPSSKEAFLAWLARMPAQTWIKRDLARAWQQYNNLPFEETDYKKATL